MKIINTDKEQYHPEETINGIVNTLTNKKIWINFNFKVNKEKKMQLTFGDQYFSFSNVFFD